MDWLSKVRLESAVRSLKESFHTIQQITGAYGVLLSADNTIMIQVDEEQLNKLCRAFNKIACLEILQNTDYPYRRHIIVDDVEFFALAEKLEELREAV